MADRNLIVRSRSAGNLFVYDVDQKRDVAGAYATHELAEWHLNDIQAAHRARTEAADPDPVAPTPIWQPIEPPPMPRTNEPVGHYMDDDINF